MITFAMNTTKQKGYRLEVRHTPTLRPSKRCSRCINSVHIKSSYYKCSELGTVYGYYTCDLHELKDKWRNK